MRNELTEEQITALMQAIPRAEKVDRLRKENERMRKENERLRADLALEKSRIVLQRGEIEKLRAEIERLREALKGIDALNPDALDALVASDLRCIVAQMGNLARAALEGKP